MKLVTTKFVAVAYGMPTTISESRDADRAKENAARKARKAMREMKISGGCPEIVCRAEYSVGGQPIQYDASGGKGNRWHAANDANCPPNILEEIVVEYLGGGKKECSDYLASNGRHYRW